MKKLTIVIFLLGLTQNIFAQKNTHNFEEEIKKMLQEHRQQMHQMFNNFFSDDFFGPNHDPFTEMEKMRERLKGNFAPQFDNWYQQRFGGELGEIKQREDDKFIYYDIQLDNINKDALNIKVENDEVKISGQIISETTTPDQKNKVVSSFSRSFPVPTNADGAKVEIESKDNIITLKFPKVVGKKEGKTIPLQQNLRI